MPNQGRRPSQLLWIDYNRTYGLLWSIVCYKAILHDWLYSYHMRSSLKCSSALIRVDLKPLFQTWLVKRPEPVPQRNHSLQINETLKTALVMTKRFVLFWHCVTLSNQTPLLSSFCLQFKCCGSNNSYDWMKSVYISSSPAEDRVVPDSCCKTITPYCGKRDHPSNIYKVEVSAFSHFFFFFLKSYFLELSMS